MKNIAPTRALTRRSRAMLQLAAVLIAGGIFISTVGLALFVVPLTSDADSNFQLYDIVRNLLFIAGVVLGIIGLGFILRALTLKTENNLARRTGDFLSQYIGDDYTYIRNLNKRDIGYVDAVLIGVAGVLVFRITDKQGDLLNERGNWLVRNSQGRLDTLKTNFTQDAVDDMKKLKDFLTLRELPDMPVFGVVVFTTPEDLTRIEKKEPRIPVTHLSNLYPLLRDGFLAKDRIDSRTVTALVKLLYDK